MSFLAVVKNNHLEFNSTRYFRAKSESVHIGSYGEKRSPIGQANYLEVQLEMPASKLNVRSVTIVDIDFTRSTAADITAHLKSADTNVSGSAAFNDLKSGKLKLVKLEMLLGDMRAAVNSAPTVLSNLRSYGLNARVAHEIFVVLEATLAQKFVSSGSVAFSGGGNTTLKMTANVNTASATTVSLSAGTTFAYLLANPDWDRGRDVIEKFTDDQCGIY